MMNSFLNRNNLFLIFKLSYDLLAFHHNLIMMRFVLNRGKLTFMAFVIILGILIIKVLNPPALRADTVQRSGLP